MPTPKRAKRANPIMKKLRAAQKQVADRRKQRAAMQAAILRDYAKGAPIAEIARKYNCHESYPAKLAARRGLTRRAIGRPKPAAKARKRRK
jgi:hypothetical protein